MKDIIKRTIEKQGDRTDAYQKGELLTLRWNRPWIIQDAVYNSFTNVTKIYLVKANN